MDIVGEGLVINEAAVNYVSEQMDVNQQVKQQIILDIVQAYLSKSKIKISLNYNNNGQHYYYLGYVQELKNDTVIIDHHNIELTNIYNTVVL